MKYQKLVKPGTNKTQMVELDRVDSYRLYGWQPEQEQGEVKTASAVVKAPKKKTAKSEPAVEYTLTVSVDSQEEVGTQDELKGD